MNKFFLVQLCVKKRDRLDTLAMVDSLEKENILGHMEIVSVGKLDGLREGQPFLKV